MIILKRIFLHNNNKDKTLLLQANNNFHKVLHKNTSTLSNELLEFTTFEVNLKLWLERLQHTEKFMIDVKELLKSNDFIDYHGIFTSYYISGGRRHFHLDEYETVCYKQYWELNSNPFIDNIKLNKLKKEFIYIQDFHYTIMKDWEIFSRNCILYGHNYEKWAK